ncbi:MAG: MFS transporter [Prolixibacteraceae bacterium]|nr:MFS transporter [Prolixibacteraceae bacterium]
MVMPVVVLFYNDNGMGMHEIFILKSIYSVAIVAMEIPSGYLADVWGRKKTLLLGSILGAAGFLIYSFSYGFMAFALAEVILGLGHSFFSGADSAMLYDTLKATGKENNYVKQEGRITSVGNFAEAFAGIAGGLLATITLRTPFFFQTIVAFSAIPASVFMIEPAIHVKDHIHSVKKLFLFVRNSLVSNLNLRIAILFSAFTGTATLTFAWLVQPYLKEVNIPVAWFGIIWTMLNLAVGVASAFAYKIEEKLSSRKSSLFILVSIATGFILSGMFIIRAGIILLFFFYIFRGLATPILKNRINQYTDSEVRATMLSVRNFVIRINFAVIGPALGYLTDNLSLKSAFIIAGCIYFTGSAFVIFPLFVKKVSK